LPKRFIFIFVSFLFVSGLFRFVSFPFQRNIVSFHELEIYFPFRFVSFQKIMRFVPFRFVSFLSPAINYIINYDKCAHLLVLQTFPNFCVENSPYKNNSVYIFLILRVPPIQILTDWNVKHTVLQANFTLLS
jgi:hypothetical protein